MKGAVLNAVRRGRLDLSDPAKAPASTIWAEPSLCYAEVPTPQITGPFDVLVRVALCGICGSDLHCSHSTPDGYVAFGGPARLPVVLGHEFTGTVVKVGAAVTNVAVGEHVTAESMWACWDCDECRAGYLNECRSVELLGLTVNGALAPLVRVDSRHCYSIEPLLRRFGPERGFEVGALLEPLGVAHRGLTRAAVTPDDLVVVVGAGPIGLAVVMLAKAAGVGAVVAFDVNDSRVALAQAAGAHAFNLASITEAMLDANAVIHGVFGGRAASIAVEAGGTVEAFDAAFASLANRGRLLVLGRMPARVPFDTNALLSKALTVIGSRGHAGHGIFPTLIKRIGGGAFDPSPLISARFQLSQLASAFAYARAGNGAKTLIHVED